MTKEELRRELLRRELLKIYEYASKQILQGNISAADNALDDYFITKKLERLFSQEEVLSMKRDQDLIYCE